MSDSPASAPYPRLHALGDAAWIVEFGQVIDTTTQARVQGLAQALAQARVRAEWPDVLETVPAYTTLTVHFKLKPDVDVTADAQQALLDLARSVAPQLQAGRRWRLPVCFDSEFAPDLQALADTRGLSPEAVVQLMTSTVFRVYMLGFQPGFPYMGGLPAALDVPRLQTPRTSVPERSVAVAGRMCAVYPWRSPGGWHLLGRLPLRLFDAAAESPAWLRSGDDVTWFAVERGQFDELEARSAAGQIVHADWLIPGPGTP